MWLREKAPIGTVAEVIGRVAFVATFAQLITEGIKPVFDDGVVVDIHARGIAVAVVRGDEPFVGEGIAVALDVAAAENGSDDVGRSRVLGDEAFFGLAV